MATHKKNSVYTKSETTVKNFTRTLNNTGTVTFFAPYYPWKLKKPALRSVYTYREMAG